MTLYLRRIMNGSCELSECKKRHHIIIAVMSLQSRNKQWRNSRLLKLKKKRKRRKSVITRRRVVLTHRMKLQLLSLKW